MKNLKQNKKWLGVGVAFLPLCLCNFLTRNRYNPTCNKKMQPLCIVTYDITGASTNRITQTPLAFSVIAITVIYT